MTVNFLQATLTKSSVMQMKLLPASNGRDSVVCLVRSYLAPERESRVTLYTLDWKPIGHVDFCADEYIARPDTMTAERFEYLKTFLDPVMFSVEMVPNENSMVVGLTTNAAGVEDKKALDSILVQRKLNWNGEIFKYCYVLCEKISRNLQIENIFGNLHSVFHGIRLLRLRKCRVSRDNRHFLILVSNLILFEIKCFMS